MKRLLLPLLLLACEPLPTDRTAEARGPIIGGTADSNDPAVVLLASYSPDQTQLYFCTATVIAPDVLLTAAHCVDESTHPDFTFGVFLGPDANAYTTASTLAPQLLPVSETRVHPDYDTAPPFNADIALVRLASPLSIEPVAVAWQPLDADIAGSEVRIVGYGQTTYDEPNAAKYAASTVVVAIDPGDTITVGDAEHRSCVGDSGGPALAMIDGVETVIGVNSYTDLTGCLEPAHYRRVDLYTAFIGELVDEPVPVAGGSGAGGGEAGGDGPVGGDASDDDADEGCAASGAAPHGSLAWLVALFFAARRRRVTAASSATAAR